MLLVLPGVPSTELYESNTSSPRNCHTNILNTLPIAWNAGTSSCVPNDDNNNDIDDIDIDIVINYLLL